jgi:hypothetical protein
MGIRLRRGRYIITADLAGSDEAPVSCPIPTRPTVPLTSDDTFWACIRSAPEYCMYVRTLSMYGCSHGGSRHVRFQPHCICTGKTRIWPVPLYLWKAWQYIGTGIGFPGDRIQDSPVAVHPPPPPPPPSSCLIMRKANGGRCDTETTSGLASKPSAWCKRSVED